MKKGKIIVLSGPSGSGKTTLYKKLLTDKRMKAPMVKTVSFTTRQKRTGERHGRDYFFVSSKMFRYKKRKGHFLETEEVFGCHYGTPKKNVLDSLRAGKNVLLCIDVKGARTIRKVFPNALTVFVKTPSLRALEKRLKKRGSEDPDIRKRRLQTAREELKEIKKYDHVIVNDDLQAAYRRLKELIKKELERVSAKKKNP